MAAGEFSTKKFLQEPEEDTEDTTGKKGGKSEEKNRILVLGLTFSC